MGLHVSIPEVLWTLVAFIGVLLRTRGIADAVEDWRASRILGADPALAVIVAGRVRGEVIGLLMKAGFVVIGLYAMTQPNPQTGFGQIIVATVLISSVALLDWNSYMNARERAVLRGYVAEEQ